MNTMTIAGAHSTIENDFYVLLVAWEEISQAGATFKVYLNPLVNLVWWGGVVLMLGIVIAAWPEPDKVRAARRVSLPEGSVSARA
jgi:cytochrome c-type biogenesis protein CcmF